MPLFRQPIFDAHIHTRAGRCDTPAVFLEKTRSVGVAGGNVFSLHPATYEPCDGEDQRFEARLDKLLAFTSETPGFLPYLFLDPREADATEQVRRAKEMGARGLKIICAGFRIADHLAPVRAAAEMGLPVMFHCGILGKDGTSAAVNHPECFECLFQIPGLRFSLAHLGWPWCDEYMGMVAMRALAHPPGGAAHFGVLYADITPGTPGIYRREALRKLYLTGYKVTGLAMWGCDLNINDYEVKYAGWHLDRDNEILAEIEREYRTGAVDRRWLPDLTDIRTPLFGGAVWRAFNGLDNGAAS